MSEIIEEIVEFSVEGDMCEGVLAYPEETQPSVALLILAPHPHFGGNLANNVVRALAQHSAADGAVSLRFNYRGLGKSTLTLPPGLSIFNYHQEAEKTQDYARYLPDCHAAWECVTRAAPNAHQVLLGYSLGAVLAGMLANEVKPAMVLGVAPPSKRVSLSAYLHCSSPKAFFAGDQDFAFDEDRFNSDYQSMPHPKHFTWLEGDDHFFRQRETSLYGYLQPWIFQ